MAAPAGPASDARLVGDLQSVFGGRLRAVVLYGASGHLPGSRAGESAVVVHSLAVVESLSAADLRACAFLMPISSIKFFQARRYSLRTTIGMAIGGVFGSALALIVVKSMPLYYVMWLVTFVIIYTGVSLLRTAAHERAAGAQTPEAKAAPKVDFNK